MKYFSRSACLGAVFLLLRCSSLFAYSGGNGTPADPYQISSVADWNQLVSASTDWDKSFVLVNDIDFAGASLTPVATVASQFTGVFDGDGHKLSNATITDTTLYGHDGLFCCIGAGGRIRNLGVENVTVSNMIDEWDGRVYGVGGLCGMNKGVIRSCYTTGDVICNGYETGGCFYVGGLCGDNTGSIINCYATGDVSGCGGVGGLCGHNSGTISNSHATGDVDAGNGGGGFCGDNDGTISMCYATGHASTLDFEAGGLCGTNCGAIGNSYARGSANGGYSYWDGHYVQYVIAELGGLCGHNWGNGAISNCYSTGGVFGLSGKDRVGGLCGVRSDRARAINCFWDKEKTSRSSSAGGSGRTTAQMQTQTTFSKAGWDFVNVWRMPVSGYPALATFLITTTSLPGGYANAAYSEPVEVIGGTPPCTWSLVSGSLPPGLTLSASTGVVSGTPLDYGSWNFAVAVSDSQNPPETIVKPLSMRVYPAIPPCEVNWLEIDQFRFTLVPGAPGGASFLLKGSCNMWFDDTVPKNVTLSIGSWSVTIGASSWKRVGNSTTYVCRQNSGIEDYMVQGDVIGRMTYWVTGTTKCTFQFVASRQVLRPNLPDLSNVPVTLQMGDSFAQTLSTAILLKGNSGTMSSSASLPIFWPQKLAFVRNLHQPARDALAFRGKLLLAEPFAASSDSIDMEIGPYVISLPAGTFAAPKNGTMKYAASTGNGKLSVQFNEKTGALAVTATGIDLSGVSANTHVSLHIANHAGADWDYGLFLSKDKSGANYKY